MNQPTTRARRFLRKPVRQEQDDAGKEASLGDAEDETQRIEAVGAPNERMAHREDAPAQHDAGDPDARAGFLHDEVARHLKEEIADEEDARTNSEGGRRQADVLVHRQGGEADVHAIEIGSEITPDEKRNEPPRNFCDDFTGIDAQEMDSLRYGWRGQAHARRIRGTLRRASDGREWSRRRLRAPPPSR